MKRETLIKKVDATLGYSYHNKNFVRTRAVTEPGKQRDLL